jgi:hypothetical protein
MAPMHHHRRRSGHLSGNSSLTDVRKAVTATDPSHKKYSSRPSMTRRTTPQTAPKLGKNPRDREKELDEQRWWYEERESFPEYWYVVNNPLLFHSFIASFRFPSGNFHFHPPALSPDMRAISVTPTALGAKDELWGMGKEGIGDRSISSEVPGGCRSCICPISPGI